MLLLRDDDVDDDDSVDDDSNAEEEDGTTDDGRREGGGVKECIDNGRSGTRSDNNDAKSIVRIVDVVVRLLLLTNDNRPRPLLVIQWRGGRSLDITAW